MPTTEVGLPSSTEHRLINNSFPGTHHVFSLKVGDIISESVRLMSPLEAWIPSQPTNNWTETVGHFVWAAAEDFDGSGTYADYIEAGLVPGECEYGDGGMAYQICEYEQTLRRVTLSNKSKPLNRFDWGGMKQWETEPRQRMRAPNGMEPAVITNDAEWVLAALTYQWEVNYAYSQIWGYNTGKRFGMFEGLNRIITTDYVRGKATNGSCDYTDPLVFNGIPLDTPEKVAAKMRTLARRVIRRNAARGGLPSPNDVCFAMHPAHWEKISEVLAAGMFQNVVVSNIEMRSTPETYQRQLDQYRRGGIGFGVFPVDGFMVPVLLDERLGKRTLVGADNAVTGHIFWLQRFFGGTPILKTLFLNWNRIPQPPGQNNSFIGMNGMVRGSWMNVNELCYYYGVESYHSMVTLMQPFQGRINNVTLKVDADDLYEAGDYSHPDFYAYGDASGGNGEVLLVPYETEAA